MATILALIIESYRKLLEITSNTKILSPFDIKGKGQIKIFSPFDIEGKELTKMKNFISK